jgi:hypothetical protein
MRSATAALLVGSLLLAGCDDQSNIKTNGGGHSGPSRTVVLTQSDYTHIGAAMAIATPATYQPQVHGYGVVVNAATLVQMDADIETAAAAVLQSEAALEHSKNLFRGTAVSLESLQSAQKLATSDQVQLALADRKEVATFGADAPWRGATRDTAMLSSIAAGTTVIVQSTLPLDVPFASTPPSLIVTHLNDQPSKTSFVATKLWRAPADPTIPGQSFYALMDAHDLEQGEHVLVYAPIGPAINGVRVPAEAVVIAEQKSWCYVLVAPLTFQRVQVDMGRPLDSGYFIAEGIAPGAQVLVKGTGLLLARELGPTGYGPD